MFHKFLAITAVLVGIFGTGCAPKRDHQSARPPAKGKPGVRDSVHLLANSGVPSISYVSAPLAPAGYGYIQCKYTNLDDATTHPTDWQRGNTSTGPWAPSSTTYYSFSAIPQTATSASGYRDYCVKFHMSTTSSADMPPPTTIVRVYTKYTTVVTIPGYL